jgi:transketolase
MIGVGDRFGESGKPPELFKKFGLTAADIVNAAQKAIEIKNKL